MYYKPVVIPEEIPWKKEKTDSPKKEKITVAVMEELWNSLSAGKKDENNFVPKLRYAVKMVGDKPVVWLSWKKNYKAVTNWIRKHMGAYPETIKGFLVKFMDDKRDGYQVIPSGKNKKWEKINWVTYEILPYTFEENLEKVKEDKNLGIYTKADIKNTLDSKNDKNKK